MKNSFYDDRDYYAGDEMLAVASHCSRFSRRRDVNSFNMTDYQSCENCRHMTADNQCALRLNDRIPRQTFLNEKP
ncbi:MAG: hypothetical protein PHE41_07390 [Eubacteriales bacterium]|nr:hypothetical protein [Eubacteriales bacterium]